MPPIHDAELWQTRLAALPLETYEAGETVFAEGTKTGRLLILKSGSVSIVRSGIEIATVAKPGAVFGELSALLTSRTARMYAPWKCRSFTSGRRRIPEARPGALLYVTVVLARRMDDANRAFFELKQQLAAGEPQGLIDATLDKIEGLLGAIGSGYIRAGAGYSGFPFA